METQISRNYCKGERITDARQLIELANNKKAVYHTNWRMKPAAFIIGMPFRLVMNSIACGHLFYISPKQD